MSVEIKPCGMTCNLKCAYCYQHESREQRPTARPDMDKLRAVIAGLTHHASLFGGEALLTPLPELEELLRLLYEKFQHSGIQTNGVLLSDKHIELFLKYHTSVGLSIDGPGPLNDVRSAGTLEATRKATAKTEAALDRLLSLSKNYSFLGPSVITTLHKGNLSPEAFPIFKEWLAELDHKGLSHINLHLLENDHEADTWAVDEDTYADRLLDLWALEKSFTTLKFSMFEEILNLLQGKQTNTVCVWGTCDPLNTQAVEGYENDGTRSGCGRMEKDGIHWLPAVQHGYERQLALYVTPQELGGCEGCTRWALCKGHCPGTGEGGDWRYKTAHCSVLKRLFSHGEKLLLERGIEPFPMWKDRLQIERVLYDGWSRGENYALESAIQTVRKTTCAPTSGERTVGWHADGHYTHGDVPHGDSGPKKVK